MKLNFTKMSGAGNDFVVIDNRDRAIALTREQIARLCHRNFGVGADGLLLVEPDENGADYRMRYYNADGGEAEMCGNGARCFARFVQPFKGGDRVTFSTPAGKINAMFQGDDVEINLTEPNDFKPGCLLTVTEGVLEVHSINTGVPHAVVFVKDADKAMVSELGRELRNHVAFEPKGTNVNFVQVTGPQEIRVRTYERGVEAETLACGTGVTAAAIVAHMIKKLPLPLRVKVQGGDTLQVNFQKDGERFTGVTLRGPADRIFTGEIVLG
jgi:diaminopimelate epimerase